MKKHLLFPVFFVLITIGATSKVWAKEFYMYSFEQRQILYMDDQPTTFFPVDNEI